jgi:hypothetical protein
LFQMKTDAQILQSEPVTGRTVRIGIAILAGAYFLWATVHPEQWRLIDGVNLIIHEAGHFVFRPLGEFMTIAGGSLFQVIVPATFAGYFYFNRKYYSAALVLFWVGASLLNVSVYAADSISMELPLLGGDNSIHDWNYLLTEMNLLRQTAKISFAIRASGTLVIILAAIWAVVAAHRSRRTVAM